MTNIIYIEDDDNLRDIVSKYLSYNRNNRIEVYSHPTAFLKSYENSIEKIKEKLSKTDLIISDVMMEEMTGINFLEYLRNNKINTPMILSSGSYEYEEKILSQNGLNHHAFIQKPFKLKSLEEKIMELLKKYLPKTDK